MFLTASLSSRNQKEKAGPGPNGSLIVNTVPLSCLDSQKLLNALISGHQGGCQSPQSGRQMMMKRRVVTNQSATDLMGSFQRGSRRVGGAATGSRTAIERDGKTLKLDVRSGSAEKEVEVAL